MLRRILPLVFIGSGATALVYEVAWVRLLTRVFGTGTHAVATVLCAFMAGLALGAWVAGRRSAGWTRRPLATYAGLEAGIALCGLAAPAFVTLVERLDAALVAAEAPVAVGVAFRFLAATLGILLPTGLMGASLPVVARAVISDDDPDGASTLGALYAANTLGAVLGTLAAGFVLIPSFGVTTTLRLSAAVNAILVVATLLLERRAAAPAAPAPSAPPTDTPSPVRSRALFLLAVAVAGGCSMLLENAWTRALTLTFGSSSHSFTVMLATFLGGLTLGSWASGRVLGRRPPTPTLLAATLFLAAGSVLATLSVFDELPLLFVPLRSALRESHAALLAAQALAGAAVLIVPTCLLGATFPQAASIDRAGALERRIGNVYAVSTLGSIAGAFVGGFVAIPRVGIQGTMAIAAILLAGAAAAQVLLDLRRGVAARVVANALFVAVAVVALGSPGWDRAVMVGGANLYHQTLASLPTPSLRREWLHAGEVVFYREGLTATISVQRFPDGHLYLRTNGKTDASSCPTDCQVQLLLGYVPLVLRPDARRAFVIGLGSGMTARALASSSAIEEVEVVEIEPAVVEALPLFAAATGDVGADPRVRLVVDDGRRRLLGTNARWDVIVSETSNPWIAGVGSLFTSDFYRRAAERLAPGGIYCQWLQVYGLTPGDVKMVLRSFGSAFPHVRLYALGATDFLLVGSLDALAPDVARARQAAWPRMAQDLASIGLPDPASVLGLELLGDATAFAGEGPLNEDDFPRLEFEAARHFDRDTAALNVALALEARPAWDVAALGSRDAVALGWGARLGADPVRAWATTEGDEGLDARALRACLAADRREANADELAAIASECRPELLPVLAGTARSLDAASAPRLLDALVARRPDDADLRAALGVALVESGAVERGEQLLATCPADRRALVALARLLLGRGDAARALEHARTARELGEASAELEVTTSEACAAVGDAAGALEHARRAATKNPWATDYRTRLATLAPPAERARLHEEVLLLEPWNVAAWKALEALRQPR